MTNRVQTLRSNAPGARPTGRLPGELYVNWADLQLGVVNPVNAPIDLLPIRFFSTAASYVIGDHVLQAGMLYVAIAAVAPGPFDPTQWVANSVGDLIPLIDARGAGDNRIINGDMRIDQRNNGAARTAIGYTVDRWEYNASTAGVGTWQRTTTAGTSSFQYALLFTSTSAHTILAADYFAFSQLIEADMIADFGWGTANAHPVTLSFWAGSSVAGMFGGSIGNHNGTRSYPFTFNLPAVVWTKVSITIPGDTAGTWLLLGNALGMIVNFDFGAGANFRGPANAWAAAGYIGVTGSVSVVATNGANFYVTGVKLEIGSVATPFNRQSLAKSLADCQRYYQITKGDIRFLASAPNQIVDSTVTFQSMRATPTANLGGSDSALNFSTPGFYPSPNVTNSGRLEIISVTPGDTYVLGVFVVLDAEL